MASGRWLRATLLALTASLVSSHQSPPTHRSSPGHHPPQIGSHSGHRDESHSHHHEPRQRTTKPHPHPRPVHMQEGICDLTKVSGVGLSAIYAFICTHPPGVLLCCARGPPLTLEIHYVGNVSVQWELQTAWGTGLPPELWQRRKPKVTTVENLSTLTWSAQQPPPRTVMAHLDEGEDTGFCTFTLDMLTGARPGGPGNCLRPADRATPKSHPHHGLLPFDAAVPGPVDHPYVKQGHRHGRDAKPPAESLPAAQAQHGQRPSPTDERPARSGDPLADNTGPTVAALVGAVVAAVCALAIVGVCGLARRRRPVFSRPEHNTHTGEWVPMTEQ